MMRTGSIVAALAVVVAVSATAQTKPDGMQGMDMKGKDMDCMSKEPASSKQASHTAKGGVKKVDAKSGMVTVAHGPVKTMDWPAMTMARI